MRKRKTAIKITRQELKTEMDRFFRQGGQITTLPAQVHVPSTRVNSVTTYLDYSDSVEECYQPLAS
ncbi:MAG: hypothetical protein HQM14_11375 [SAR324 cluster bacterium]|nr:hypothetical protein [SAR324 cluster bacterium]